MGIFQTKSVPVRARVAAQSCLTSVLCGVLTACGGGQHPDRCPAEPLAIRVEASPSLNPSAAGEPLPTQLVIAQLAGRDAARATSFEGFWTDQGKTALGADLLSAEAVTVYPGARNEYWFEREANVQFVLAAGLFRQPSGETWRSLAVLPRIEGPCEARRDPRRPLIQFAMNGYRLSVAPWNNGQDRWAGRGQRRRP